MSMFKVYDNLKIMSILLLSHRICHFLGRIYRKSGEIGIKAASEPKRTSLKPEKTSHEPEGTGLKPERTGRGSSENHV